MTHPCADHMASCDHCWLCDELGVCCASVSAAQRTQLEAARNEPYAGLVAVIVSEIGRVPTLAELLRADVERQRLGRALPATPPLQLPALASESLPIESRKESNHVVSSRPPR